MPFFRKPFKLFAIDADTGKPLDANVRRKVTYYEVKKDSNGSKSFVAHKSAYKVGDATKDKGEVTTEDVKKDKGGDKKTEAKKDDAAAGEKKNGGGGDKADVAPFTKEEDEKLRTLKGENKSWNDIIAEMGRAKKQLTHRWKEIEGAPKVDDGKKEEKGGAGGDQKDQKKKGDGVDGEVKKNNHAKNGKKNNDSNDAKAEKNADKKQQQKENKPAASTKKDSKVDTNDARFTMADWQTLQEDSLFSFGELQCLSEIIAKDSDHGWQRVASRFYDLTGRRVHPDDVREKFEGLAAYA